MQVDRPPPSPTCPHGVVPHSSDLPLPSPGDVTLCLECGQLLTYGQDGAIGPLPPEDFSLLSLEDRDMLTVILKAIQLRKQLQALSQEGVGGLSPEGSTLLQQLIAAIKP